MDPPLVGQGSPAGPGSGGVLQLLPQYDNMLSCIRCGLCLSVCPTYQISFAEEEGPRGRIAMARALAEGHVGLTPDLIEHEEGCLLCEACTVICPAGVQMEPIGVAVREVFAESEGEQPKSRFLRWFVFQRVFMDMLLFRYLCFLALVYQRSGWRMLLRRLGVLRLLGLARLESLLPDMQWPFFVPKGQVCEPQEVPLGEAMVFAGCIMSTAFSETDRATARVLAVNGYRAVACAGQGCCGALHLHSGLMDKARILARRNIDAFEANPDAPVIVNAAGCGSTLKGYGHLLADDPDHAERAARFAERVRDATEFLAGIPLRRPEHAVQQTVTLQEPCHLAHAQRIRQAPRQVLDAIPGLKLIEMDESAFCCGSAGIYNIVQPERSSTLLDRKLKAVLATDAETVVTANPGCQLQIQAGLRATGSKVRVRHIVDLLDEAYGTTRE